MVSRLFPNSGIILGTNQNIDVVILDLNHNVGLMWQKKVIILNVNQNLGLIRDIS